MFFSKDRKKRKAIKIFLEKLPTDLKSRYGVKEFYTFGQLESTLNLKGYPKVFHDYAFAPFMDEREAIDKFGSIDRIQSLKLKVALWFFEGDTNYAVKLADRRRVGNETHCSGGVSDD